MLMASSIVSHSLTSIPVISSYRSKPYRSSNVSTPCNQTLFLGEKLLNNIKQVRKNAKFQRDFYVFSAIQPGVPPPSQPPSQLLNWVVGVVATIILPFAHRWSSLLKIRNEVETAVETIEEIVEVVDKVAEGVEKVAEDIADHLPQDGRLRRAVDFVENVAETVHEEANLVEDLIDKVQEAEEKLGEYVESLVEEAHEHREQVHRLQHHQETNDGLQKL